MIGTLDRLDGAKFLDCPDGVGMMICLDGVETMDRPEKVEGPVFARIG